MPSFVVEIVKIVTVRTFVRVKSARDATDAAALIAGRADAIAFDMQYLKIGGPRDE